jgi:hypothetical protein
VADELSSALDVSVFQTGHLRLIHPLSLSSNEVERCGHQLTDRLRYVALEYDGLSDEVDLGGPEARIHDRD